MRTMMNRLAGRPLALAGGLGAISAYLVCSTAAWLLYPGSFSPLKNWLSDLGNPIRNPAGAVWYNVGCVVTALALLLFIRSLSWWRSASFSGNTLIGTSQVTGLASVLSLALIGVYSENDLRRHMIYSNWFFACFPLFILLFSTGLITQRNRKRIGLVGLGVVVIGLWFHLVFPGSRPMEWGTELAFLMYVGMVAWNTQSHSESSPPTR